MGLASTLLTGILLVVFFTETSVKNSIHELIKNEHMGGLISIAAVPNLALFFGFLNRKHDMAAQGILAATVFIALLTLILKTVV